MDTIYDASTPIYIAVVTSPGHVTRVCACLSDYLSVHCLCASSYACLYVCLCVYVSVCFRVCMTECHFVYVFSDAGIGQQWSRGHWTVVSG